jgi:hypothetical protein
LPGDRAGLPAGLIGPGYRVAGLIGPG